MAGQKQHYIPQFILRGFGSQTKGRQVHVAVYAKDKKPFTAATDGIAAQRFFYSDQRDTSLDDEITKYENRLRSLYVGLCSAPCGTDLPQADVAELCTHLCIRQAHMRNSFASVASSLVTSCGDLFLDKEKARDLMGLNDAVPSGMLLDEIRSTFQKYAPMLRLAGFTQAQFEAFAFEKMKGGYDDFFPAQAEAMKKLTVNLSGQVDEAARNGHNKALSQTLAPDLRMEELRQFQWRHYPMHDHGVVLPDCISVCRTHDGAYAPLVFADRGTIESVYVPLRHDLMMVASADGLGKAPDDINEISISCSRDFFIAHKRHPLFDRAAGGIGNRLEALLSALADGALEDVYPESRSLRAGSL